MARQTINYAHGDDTRNSLNSNFKELYNESAKFSTIRKEADSVIKEAKRVNDKNVDVQGQIDKLILSEGESDAEVVQARGNAPLLKDRLNKVDENLEELSINAKNYGMSTSASWQTNRDALQQANDYAYSLGGGKVLIPPGNYLVKGVIQDSNVVFSMYGATLKNPDGLAPHVIQGRENTGIGNTSKDSKVITMNDTTNLDVGSRIAVEGAGEMLKSQSTSLESASITPSTTSFKLKNDDGKFPNNDYLRIGSELIKYSTINNGTVNVTERGALGTSASSHSKGDRIGLSTVMYTDVVKISGNKVTVKDSIPLNLYQTNIHYGVLRAGIIGGQIDGNKVPTGSSSSVYNTLYRTAKSCYFNDVLMNEAEHGGIHLGRGTKDCKGNNVTFRNCGVVSLSSGNKGAGLWMFQGCENNTFTNVTFSGSGWVGCYIDDRTTLANKFDAPNYDNSVTSYTIDFDNEPSGYNPGMIATGSSRNKFINGSIKGPFTGVVFENGSQFLEEPGVAKDNQASIAHLDVRQPWRIDGPNNKVDSVIYTDRLIAQPVTHPTTFLFANSTVAGGSASNEKTLLGDGMPSKPALSFTSDTDTGMFKYGADAFGFSNGGVATIFIFPTVMRFKDGYTLETGTTTGLRIGLNGNDKIGFYGKTPIAQQPTLENTSGYTLKQLEYEVNAVKNVLRNIGIIKLTP